MLKIKLKPSLFLGLLIFLLFSLPKDTYNPEKDLHKAKYNESLFANKPPIPVGHKNFILKLIPLIQNANQKVLVERQKLLKIYSKANEEKKIKNSEKRWLKNLDLKYRGEKNQPVFNNEEEIDLEIMNDLLSRVDMVPIRMALAQAAIESGWGSSRFCKEGNSYFGIHCYKPDCGIKARANIDGGFQVKSYKSAQESVDDYLLFLNSKRGMQRFRNERVYYFYDTSTTHLLQLTSTLKGYSADSEYYQNLIRSILRKYIPENIANN